MEEYTEKSIMNKIYILSVNEHIYGRDYKEEINNIFQTLELAKEFIPEVQKRIISSHDDEYEVEYDYKWKLRKPDCDNEKCVERWALFCKKKGREKDFFVSLGDEIFIYEWNVIMEPKNIKPASKK